MQRPWSHRIKILTEFLGYLQIYHAEICSVFQCSNHSTSDKPENICKSWFDNACVFKKSKTEHIPCLFLLMRVEVWREHEMLWKQEPVT